MPQSPRFSLSILLLCSLCLGACQQRDALEEIQHSGELRVLTRNSPTTYYLDKGEPAGFEYMLSKRFADELGVELDMQGRYTLEGLLLGLRRAEADYVTAGLSIRQGWKPEFKFSAPYEEVETLIIYRAGKRRPRKPADLLESSVLVTALSSQESNLQAMKKDLPELSWRALEDNLAADLMALVSEGKADYALVASNEFTANHSYFPKLRVGFSLQDQVPLGWLFPDRPEYLRLQRRADAFLRQVAKDGSLEQLREQNFGHAWDTNPVDSQTFNRRMRKRLPKYESIIRDVAEEYQLDWQLLAAISYQESHWNPHAKSPTGVRGMMMLTQTTAREMDISDRLDPAQSLRGGARYFRKLRRRLPEDIIEPDRTWFALAAYNIGRGHLEDARIITEKQGGNPDLWLDVAERLPLLQKSKFYRTTKYGYARGSEPVTYVKNIRHYYNILAWRELAHNQPRAPISTTEYVPPILQASRLSAL